MSAISFAFSGDDAEDAASEFKAVCADLEPGVNVAVARLSAVQSKAGDKAIDPVAVGALIAAIPSALLAVADIADRIKKRRAAQKLIDDAKHLQSTRKVQIHLLVENVATPLEKVTADILIETANR